MRKYGEWPQDRSLITPELIQWHDKLLAQNWDATIAPTDTVWVLGDLVANNKHLDEALVWMASRPGIKRFIFGNHDAGHPMHRDAHLAQPKYRNAFASAEMAAKRVITIDGQKVTLLLSHFPYTGDGDSKEQDRDTQWRLREESTATTFGLPVLHGHTHTAEKVSYGEWGGSLQIHVGLDAWDLRPIPEAEIIKLLEAERGRVLALSS